MIAEQQLNGAAADMHKARGWHLNIIRHLYVTHACAPAAEYCAPGRERERSIDASRRMRKRSRWRDLWCVRNKNGWRRGPFRQFPTFASSLRTDYHRRAHHDASRRADMNKRRHWAVKLTTGSSRSARAFPMKNEKKYGGCARSIGIITKDVDRIWRAISFFLLIQQARPYYYVGEKIEINRYPENKRKGGCAHRHTTPDDSIYGYMSEGI